MRFAQFCGGVVIAAVSGLAAARGPVLHVSFSKTKPDSGLWHTDIVAAPGETVYVRIEMSIPESFYGVTGARFNITSYTPGGWDVGGDDVVDLTPGKGSVSDGRYPGFDFGGQTQAKYESPGSLRIDAKGDNGDNPNAGISTTQKTPGSLGTLFNTSKHHVPFFKFAIHLSENQAPRAIVLGVLTAQITSFKAYESASSTAGTNIPGAEGDTGTITIVPAPGALAAVGIAGLAAIRRRR